MDHQAINLNKPFIHYTIPLNIDLFVKWKLFTLEVLKACTNICLVNYCWINSVNRKVISSSFNDCIR